MNFFQTISNPNLLTFVQMNENIYIDTHYQVGRVFSLSLQMILFSCTFDTKLKVQHTNMPQARSHLHLARPRPSNASFTARLPYPHLRGNSSSLGTNVTILGPNYKCSIWHHFHYSRVKLMEFFHMPKELNDLSDQVIVTLVPNKEEFPRNNGQEWRPGNEGGMGPNRMKMWSSPGLQKSSFIFGLNLMSTDQWSRLKSSMLFKHDLALQNKPLSKQPFTTQPQTRNEDVTWSSQYICPSQESIV